MTARRDRLLQQLGITQWVLRRPTALKGEVSVSVPEEVRLLCISEETIPLQTPLVEDILRALHFTGQEMYCLTPEELPLLPSRAHRIYWFAGVEPILSTQVVQITSPAWSELVRSASAKRKLWQQICKYDSDIFTDPRRS